MQQAGQQGSAAGLGRQCDGDGGEDRTLRASTCALDLQVHFVCARCVYSCGTSMVVNKGFFFS